MTRRAWSHDELVLTMNLYCRLPFGRLHARNPDVIKLASAIGRTPSSVAMKLCNLASLDPANRQRGVRGLTKVSRGDRQVWDEFHSNWNRLAAESELLRTRIVGTRALESGARSRTAGPLRRDEAVAFSGTTEALRTVKVRLAQRFFRRSVLASYESRCCVCNIAIRPLLIASHILPWNRYPQIRADPRNGICLSRLHDAAFDRGLISFDDEYRLILSTQLRGETANSVLRESFVRFEGKRIQLPEKLRPMREYLAKHREEVFRD
jgi:putative restriction endonuclease